MITPELHKFFRTCESPRTIVNPHTLQAVTVPCGVCVSCLNRMSDRASQLCQIEEQDHKYAFFATFTYDNDNIPRMYPFWKDNVCYFRSACQRDSLNGEVLTRYSGSRTSLNDLLAKAGLNGALSYCSVDDCQKLIKRIRFHVNKKCNEKIRYYAILEYGPVSFRAHIHLVLYFDSESTLAQIGQIVHKSWQYGRVRASLSRGKVASYVASYVNCHACLPRLYSSRKVKPRSFHSRYFAAAYYQPLKEKLYTDATYCLDEIERKLGKTYIPVHSWPSLRAYLYPRPTGYSSTASDRLPQLYLFYRRVQSVLHTDKPMKMARYMTSCLFGRYGDSFRYNSALVSVLNDLCRYYGIRDLDCLCDENYDKLLVKIYNLLRISKHFIEFICNNSTNIDFIKHRISIINEYYYKRDMSVLSRFYTLQEKYVDDPAFSVDSDYWRGYLAFYDGFYHHIKFDTFDYDLPPGYDYKSACRDSPLWQSGLIASRIRYETKIKHKKLNDANKALIAELDSYS